MLYQTATSQAVTPTTETSTVYYYFGGQFARQVSDEMLRHQTEMFDVAFCDDKVMIEAQQAVINLSLGKSTMALSFDRSVGQFRRLMAGLVEEEAMAR